MKVVFIPWHINKKFKNLNKLKKEISSYDKVIILYTVQFENQMDKIVHELNAINGGITLGCRERFPQGDCYIVVSTGIFHALRVAVKTKKPVYVLSPEGYKKLDQSLVLNYEKKVRAKFLKFLSSKRIGVVISTKPGQFHEALAFKIKEILNDKEVYIFVANEINRLNLDDFPIDFWINTACPRLAEDEFDKPMLNWEDIKELSKNYKL